MLARPVPVQMFLRIKVSTWMWKRTRGRFDPRVRKGEIGCVFDEIQNLVEPIERLDMDV
jgi:hypothetical protein